MKNIFTYDILLLYNFWNNILKNFSRIHFLKFCYKSTPEVFLGEILP